MSKRQSKKPSHERTPDLLRDLIIVQLGLAGVGQKEIRKIVGGGIHHINSIVKLLRKKLRNPRIEEG